MQKHYDELIDTIHELKCKIRSSSLNREEYDNVWGKLKHIEEQVLPWTLTWITEEEKAKLKLEAEKPKTFQEAICSAFKQYMQHHNL